MKQQKKVFVWVLTARDNVGSVVGSDANKHTRCTLRGAKTGDVVVRSLIPHGHKIALCAMDQGAFVIKYGVPIGRTTTAILAGGHVHTQNMESLRGRGDLARSSGEGPVSVKPHVARDKGFRSVGWGR